MNNFVNETSNPMQLKDLKEPTTRRLLPFEDPNNAPPTEGTSILSPNGRNSLLFEPLSMKIAPHAATIRHTRTRTESFSHSRSLLDEVPLAQTTSTPNPIQRRSTLSGLEISVNRTTSLDINTGGLLDAFGPALFTAGWDQFTPTNHQSPLSAFISNDAGALKSSAPASAVDTVVSAIDFLDIGGPSSLQLVEDPFNTYSPVLPSLEASRPNTSQSRLRSYSSAFATSVKPVTARHRSISIPEKDLKAEFEEFHSVAREASVVPSPKIIYSESSSPTENPPSRSLWVGNLDPSIPQNEVLSMFVPFGPIESLRMIPERECAFINFVNVEDASKAKATLNGGYIGSCIIRIAYGRSDLSSEGGVSSHSSKSLWIGNIPATLEPSDLEKLFGTFGPIESARVLSHKNCGFINFVRVEDAVEARKHMNGKEISGAIVKIGFAKVPTNTSATPMLPSASNENAGEWPADVNAIMMNSSSSSSGWPSNFISSALPVIDNQNATQGNTIYATSIPGLPISENRLDSNLMREFRKRLEIANVSAEQVQEIFNSVIYDAAAVSADYMGNVVIQKLVEKGTEDQRFQIIQQIAPHIASIGIHKNGTWAVQKILDTENIPKYIKVLCDALTPYTPALLLDQYGNYVVQCCLRFGSNYNQFIFDSISCNMLKIGLARFGARATRTCLESQFTTKAQQKLVATNIIKNCYELSCDQNGALLMSWLLDSYNASGKYAELVSAFKQNLVSACSHKIASAFILKICVQKTEPEAREAVLDEIFSTNLASILSDPVNGTSLIRKVLSNATKDQSKLMDLISKFITKSDVQKYPNIKRFLEEFSISLNHDNVSR